MKKILIPLLGAAVAFSGCHHHSNKVKPSPTVATDAEREFMQRWVDQRVHDYLTQGKFANEDDARAQATKDFYREYPYTTLAQKAGMGAPEPK